MTIFPLEITRFPEWTTVYLLRGNDGAELENLSDRSLEDIGLEPPLGGILML